VSICLSIVMGGVNFFLLCLAVLLPMSQSVSLQGAAATLQPAPARPPVAPPLPKANTRPVQVPVSSKCGQRMPNVTMLELMQTAMDEDRAIDLEPDGELSQLARQVQIQLPGDDRPTVVMTSINAGFWPLTLNFLCSWERVPTLDSRSIFFFAVDQSSARKMRKRGHVVFLAKNAPEVSDDASFGTLDYLFINIYRSQVVRQLLALGYNVLQVDMDEVWLKDPFPFISTYLKPGIDLVAQPNRESPDAGIPCGGFMLLRCTETMRRQWDEILLWLEEAFVSYAQADCVSRRDLGDQLGLIERVRAKKITMELLPRELFPPGTLYFKKNTKLRPISMVVHNNWIIGLQPKIARFKEFGLWFVETEEGGDQLQARCTN
jgi:hypothetical protein